MVEYKLKYEGEKIDELLEAVDNGSVVTSNTTSVIESENEKPVSSDAINRALGNKVDKILGYGLSEWSYTSEDRDAVATVKDGSIITNNTVSSLIKDEVKPISSSAMQKLWRDKGYTFDGVRIDGSGTYDVYIGGSGGSRYILSSNAKAEIPLDGTSVTFNGEATITASVSRYQDESTGSYRGTLTVSVSGGLPLYNTFFAESLTPIMDALIPHTVLRKDEVLDNISAGSTLPVQSHAIHTALTNKVDKEPGKGLSTNDYTTAEQEQVAKIAKQGAMLSKHAEDIAKNAEELTKKADNDKYYAGMGVGVSDNLRGRGEATEEVFSYRPSAGVNNDIEGAGTATIKKIKGNSVVYSQLLRCALDQANKGKFGWWVRGLQYQGVTASIDGTTIRYNVVSEAGNNNQISQYVGNLAVGDKILLIFGYNNNGVINDEYKRPWYVRVSNDIAGNITQDIMGEIGAPNQGYVALFITVKTEGLSYIILKQPYTGIAEVVPTTMEWSDVQLYNLTQMFGAGNEPTTIEEFRELYPNDYYEYSEPTLHNMAVEGIKTVGFNLLNGNEAKVMKGMTYVINNAESITLTPTNSTETINVVLDEDNTYTAGATGTLNVVAVAGTDACVHFQHSGYNNGVCEPYEEHTLSLPIVAELFSDCMRSAGNVCDEIDFERKRYIKMVGSVDLGSLNWERHNYGNESNPKYAFITSSIKDGIAAIGWAKSNILASKYNPTIGGNVQNVNLTYGTEYVSDKTKCILKVRDDSYTDAESFKTAMSGVILNYELAEPIITPLPDNINNNYHVWDWGTEEAILKPNSAPFRANIVYGFNAVDTIRRNKSNIEALDNNKQNALTLTVKDNGNIVIGNIAGQTKEFMPATPSGDPMHYYYLSHFGVTYNESTGFFELEYLKNLTANDMRNAVRVSGNNYWLYNDASSVSELVAPEDRPRTNIAMRSGTFQIRDKHSVPMWERSLEQWIIGKCSAYSFATLTDVYDSNVGLKLALVGMLELRYIVGVIDISTLRNGYLPTLLGDVTTQMQEVRLAGLKTSQTIIYQTKLSKESISYLLSNRINTEEISLSLPAELYNKIMTDGGEWAGLRSLCEATTDKGKVILELNA